MTSEPEVQMKDFKVYIMTWNVVCRGPIEDLRSALGLDPPVNSSALPDLYAVGFQEVSARPQCLLRQAFFEEPWIQAVRTALRKYRYVKEYSTIIEKQTFDDINATSVLNHNYAFWFGDLNFRIDDCTIRDLQLAIENGTVHDFLKKDQLINAMRSEKAFHHFQEHEITFLPTYKYLVDSHGFNYSHRKPAWTDRIMYRFTRDAYENVVLDVKQHHYQSHNLYIQSDHKPVSGSFTIKVFAKPEQPIVFFFPVGPWSISHDCLAWYYTNAGMDVLPSDWVALYKDNFTSLDDHICFVWASRQPVDSLPYHLMEEARKLYSVCSSHPLCTCGDGGAPTPPTPPPGDRSAAGPLPCLGATRVCRRHDQASGKRVSTCRTFREEVKSPESREETVESVRTYSERRQANAHESTAWTHRTVSPYDHPDDMAEAPSPCVLATSSCPVRDEGQSSAPTFYRVLFGSQNLLLMGKYRLLYLRGDSDVLGMSGSFKVTTPLIV
ncbi:uncharacterized protein LOC135370157 isoform X2 [Ornithodoros turicata]|uniref:uncharacterized protein LOC135370157 isoform X2 n=1 Tax=Ornithodoros turicata TaxID=34597 RepID=UPI003139C20A